MNGVYLSESRHSLVMLHLCNTRQRLPQPVSVSPFELDRGLKNASVLSRASSEFCDKPKPTYTPWHNCWNFSPWRLVAKNAALELDGTMVPPLSIFKELAFAVHVQKLAGDWLEILCLR
ncbi:hypothetical protein PISMIDRAFT_490889 [Pisolithus microcarpus 441]|uniref:Uncharacterized protein n=1 Tax=Pisolithus microcarpus 441 TaxID=765257 RepID=A0A0C9YUN7_9AGAM|nr:hypothetical protein PISMIDRAFT_490889 [Pisolithus microcarpus 441]